MTGRKFRIYPTSDQSSVLSKWIGCQRVIRNAKISEISYRLWLKRNSKFKDEPGLRGVLDSKYSHFKTPENRYLGNVPSILLKEGVSKAVGCFMGFIKGVKGFPRIKNKSSTESVRVPDCLFSFNEGFLHLGTKKFPVGSIKWKPTRNYESPKTITITRQSDRWFVSFSYEDDYILPSNRDSLIQHSFCKPEKLLALDPGVVHPLTDSDRNFHDLPNPLKKRLLHMDSRKLVLQQKLSRQVYGSNSRLKTKLKIQRISYSKTDLIVDWCHKTSSKLAKGPHNVIVFEDLKLNRLTKRPKVKSIQLPNGGVEYQSNGAAAKAGLNKALLEIGLGRLRSMTEYKCLREGKAFLKTPAQFSSQECHKCGDVNRANRLTQAEFHCQACGHKDHADYNASMVHRNRGFRLLQNYRPQGIGGRKTTVREIEQVEA